MDKTTSEFTQLLLPMKDGEVSYGDLENLISKQIEEMFRDWYHAELLEVPTLCKDEHRSDSSDLAWLMEKYR